MAKMIQPEQLHDAVMDILNDYKDDVHTGTKEAVKTVTKLGVKNVKAGAKTKFKVHPRQDGKNYWKGWTSIVETGRMSAQGTIYNRTLPGLPHLLENGHAKRGGGRVPGRVHIAPVQEEVTQALEKAIKKAI